MLTVTLPSEKIEEIRSLCQLIISQCSAAGMMEQAYHAEKIPGQWKEKEKKTPYGNNNIRF